MRVSFGQLIDKYLSVSESIMERQEVEIELIVAYFVVVNKVKNGLFVCKNLRNVLLNDIYIILIVGVTITFVIDAVADKDAEDSFFLLPWNGKNV